jgi:hypothetical protein
VGPNVDNSNFKAVGSVDLDEQQRILAQIAEARGGSPGDDGAGAAAVGKEQAAEEAVEMREVERNVEVYFPKDGLYHMVPQKWLREELRPYVDADKTERRNGRTVLCEPPRPNKWGVLTRCPSWFVPSLAPGNVAGQALRLDPGVYMRHAARKMLWNEAGGAERGSFKHVHQCEYQLVHEDDMEKIAQVCEAKPVFPTFTSHFDPLSTELEVKPQGVAASSVCPTQGPSLGMFTFLERDVKDDERGVLVERQL